MFLLNSNFLPNFLCVFQISSVELQAKNVPYKICRDCCKTLEQSVDFRFTAFISSGSISLWKEAMPEMSEANVSTCMNLPMIQDILNSCKFCPSGKCDLEQPNHQNPNQNDQMIEYKQKHQTASEILHFEKNTRISYKAPCLREGDVTQNSDSMGEDESMIEPALNFEIKENFKYQPPPPSSSSSVIVNENSNTELDAKSQMEMDQYLQNVQKTAENRFPCSKCVHSFKDKRYLRLHLQRHYNLLPHKCLVCDKNFATLTNLKKHAEIHKTTLDYECQVCFEKFKTRDSLTRHTRKHHAKEAKDGEMSTEGRNYSNAGY